MNTRTRWNDMTTARRARQATRAHRRELEQALAVYASPAEIDDMLAVVENQQSPDAELVRDILTQNLALDRGRNRAHLRTSAAA